MNPMLEAALKYANMGFSIIPIIPGTKKAMIKWEIFQSTKADKLMITSWWGNTPNANVGIVTGKISNVNIIDIDTEEGQANIAQYIPDSFLTPTCKTPRGGQHLYCLHHDGLTNKVGVIPGTDFRGEGGYVVAPPSVNGNGIGYIWLSGLNPSEIAFAELPIEYINKIYAYRGGVDRIGDSLQTSTESTNVYTKGRRDNDLFHVANLLVKGRCDHAILQKTLEILAGNCNPPFLFREVEIKIKSALERANRRERNLMNEIREDVLSTNGVFLSTEQAKRLQLSTREEIKNQSICLKRLWKNECLIEKYGNRNGCWRVVDQDEEIIDIFNADLAPFDISLPFRIQEYVTIHKGNVIIIAGESNAGKTSFCLNVAKMNRDGYPVNYLSSEMQNGAELRIRLNEFGEPIENWKVVKFQFRTDNFPDKIMPDAINIIDYLDEGNDEEAHRMPARIRNIANKLQRGIAVIAIQKDPNKQFGYGGSGTLNRARLYITVTKQGVLTVVKGKIWRNKTINPNGMFCNYKLAAGCKYSMEGGWKW